MSRMFWTYEATYLKAKEFETTKDFRIKAKSAYESACRNGWLKDYDWLRKARKECGYWCSYEKCYEAAKQCKTRSELNDKFPAAYRHCCKNNWLDNFTWLIDKRIDFEEGKIDSVYAYIFENLHTIYIGRTLCQRQKERDKAHRTENTSVSKFAKEHGVEVPEPTYLENGITLKEGVEKEKFYIEKYKNEGWNLINKMPGGGIGGLAKGKWTYNKVKEEAQKYTTITDFGKYGGFAYDKAHIMGWIADFTWLEYPRKKNNYWNYETCYEEAKKYRNRSEFQDKSCGAFKIARKNGWLEDYTWFTYDEKLPSGYWDEEHCREEALKYKSRYEFKQGNGSAYYSASRNKWLDDYDWFVPSKSAKKWTYETCRNESEKYKTKAEFRKGSEVAFQTAQRNGWLKDFTWLESAFRYTYELCYEIAKKYKSVKEFVENDKNVYNAANHKGWLKDYDWLQRECVPNGYWDDYNNSYQEALKHKTLNELHFLCPGCYSIAKKNDWLKDYTWLEQGKKKRVKKGTWENYDNCYKEALKYKSLKELKAYASGCYLSAYKNGWLKDYTWLYESEK